MFIMANNYNSLTPFFKLIKNFNHFPLRIKIEIFRESAKEAAELRGMSFSAFMRACMMDELSKKVL